MISRFGGFMEVSGVAERPIYVAPEDVRLSIMDDEFGEHVLNWQDLLCTCLEVCLDELPGPALSSFHVNWSQQCHHEMSESDFLNVVDVQ